MEYNADKTKRVCPSSLDLFQHNYEKLAAEIINAARATVVRERWLTELDGSKGPSISEDGPTVIEPSPAVPPPEPDDILPNLAEI